MKLNNNKQPLKLILKAFAIKQLPQILTTDQEVGGLNPSRVTYKIPKPLIISNLSRVFCFRYNIGESGKSDHPS